MDLTPLWLELEPGRKLTLPLGLLFWYTEFMGKSIKVHQKKRVGRPPTGRDPAVTVRLPAAILDAVEDWAARQDDKPARSPAIRRLVEKALNSEVQPKPFAKAGRRTRAKELAKAAIEKLADPAASLEERTQRQRRLTKGPTEFREVRVDQPKAKGK